MKVNSLFTEIKKKFPSLEIQRRDVEDIVTFHTGLSWSELQLKSDNIVKDDEIEAIWKDLDKLKSGQPCAYILKEKHFFKNNFKVGPGVLIPRPETEILVESALELYRPAMKVADLGAGSGCIGLSLAKEWPDAFVQLFEASSDALALCRANAECMKLENVECIEARVTQGQPVGFGPFDLIVANPPYIAVGDSRVEKSVYDYEPHQALYADKEGLQCIEDWLHWAKTHLKADGHYLFEFGQFQEGEIQDLIDPVDFSVLEIKKDYQGIPRFFHLCRTSQ